MFFKILRRIKSWIFPKPVIIYCKNTYSQVGEDAIINFLFAEKKLTSINYLDIGTSIPDEGNNTYLFYQNGHRGVCVEADSSLIPLIKKIRPNDKTIHAGVSVANSTEADFYIFNEKGLNTFNKSEAEKRALSGAFKILSVVKVPLININELVKENFESYPDLLSIDIEGLDLDVLNSLDFSCYPIPVICVETCTYSENHIRPKDLSISDFMSLKGYKVYADTYVNTIFVNKDWFYKIV